MAIVIASACLLAGGCSSSETAPISPKEVSDFKGGPAAPQTPEQKAAKQQAMQDFQEKFKQKHPVSGGQAPAGQAPAGQAPAGQ